MDGERPRVLSFGGGVQSSALQSRSGWGRLVDTEGRCHLIARAQIMRVVPAPRPDGWSFSSGAVVRLRDGSSIGIYDRERAALEEALLAPQAEQGGEDDG